ncbi:MAG: glycosyltransferase [Desulfobulbaceae bacterium]|nr:glycosyltransferase [Desulfobulbaceae bacterium]
MFLEVLPLPDITVSVVIPTLNAAAYLAELLDSLQNQKYLSPFEIILVESGSTDGTVAIASRYPEVRIVPIADFSHGRSRNLGASHATGDIVVFLTQDALPQDDGWLKNLLAPFADQRVAATYSRQVPRPDAPFTERFFLSTRFPAGPAVYRQKSREDEVLTFEKVFFSNVSSAVRRFVLVEYPFDETLIMSEDQQLSRDLLEAGYAVVYAPESVVIHSHNYSLPMVFKRYFDSVYSLTEIFPSHGFGTSASMGGRYLAKEFRYVLKNYPQKLGYYFLYTAAKTFGTLLGHFVKVLPRFLVRKFSMHKYHWNNQSG